MGWDGLTWSGLALVPHCPFHSIHSGGGGICRREVRNLDISPGGGGGSGGFDTGQMSLRLFMISMLTYLLTYTYVHDSNIKLQKKKIYMLEKKREELMGLSYS